MNNHVYIAGTRHGSHTRLDPYVESYVGSLTTRNYTEGTIKGYRVLLRRLAVLMEERGIRPEDLTVELAAEVVQGEERNKREPHKYANIAARFVGHLVEIGVATAPTPTAKQAARQTLRRDYEDYLRRGNSTVEPRDGLHFRGK